MVAKDLEQILQNYFELQFIEKCYEMTKLFEVRQAKGQVQIA